MVKVKLRVPLSSAPRETSSPLANPHPLRSAPDYSDDDDEPTSALRDGATPDHNANLSDAEELDEDQDDQDQEADELDELDELEAEDDAKTASSSTLKRRSITIKSRSKSGAGSSASPSNEGSASPHSGGSKSAKRGNLARIAQVQAMSVEELDALPAAKRRKTAKARGAAGPGRGWRKGLTKGQKPVYELPPAETTPATFGNTADARSSPAAAPIKAETPTPSTLPSTILPRPKSVSNLAAAAAESSSKPFSTSAASGRSGATYGAAASSSSIKIVSGPGGQTFTGDLSAKAGTAKNPGFRYPPLPSSRAGPPVQPIARIPTSFQAVIPLERNARQPRRWTKAKREILSMGGRPWSIPVFYGGEDRGYEKKVDGAVGSTTAAVGAAVTGADKQASKSGTPSAPTTATAAAAGTATAATGAKTASPAPSTPAPVPAATSSTPLAKGGSPLPPPKHLNGLNSQAETNWRGQSPAFLFGGR